MKHFKYLTYAMMIVLVVSCTDKSTFNNPAIHQLENGAFIRFENVNAINADYPEPQNLNISQSVFDANGNTSSYRLTVEGNIGGVMKYNDNLITINSFPSTIDITSQSLADALGVDVDDFSYGDTFVFKGIATRDDGTVFYPETPSLGTRGNTEKQLNNVPNYTSAMSFGFVFFTDCPPVPGDYKINMADSYGDGWQGTGIKVTIDGVDTYITLCSPYSSDAGTQEGCIGDGDSSGVYTLTVEPGTTSWSWNWTSDRYPSEVSFTVDDPNGVEIFAAATPADDQMLPVINCL